MKALAVTSLSSSAANHRLFCSATRLHCAVRLFVPFRAFHGTSMSYRGQCGLGVLHSYRITTVYLTCWFQKCTSIAVQVDALPLQP